jgi:hypothetical protein
VPLMLFALLFGLSMDYEVFLLTAVQRRWSITRDNLRSVREGLSATGGVITAAATIMVGVFLAFVPNDDPTIKMFGVGMAAAIAIDATVVRGLLVPATMALLGALTWWTPRRPRGRVRPAPRHAARHASRGGLGGPGLTARADVERTASGETPLKVRRGDEDHAGQEHAGQPVDDVVMIEVNRRE